MSTQDTGMFVLLNHSTGYKNKVKRETNNVKGEKEEKDEKFAIVIEKVKSEKERKRKEM